jgi:predicted alpha/beta-hydrolase family hydrolase
MPVDISVSLGDEGQTTAVHYAAAHGSGALLVLAHGAGAGQQHPFMVVFARGLAAEGIDVVTFNFLYRERQRRAPDKAPLLERCFRRVIEAVRERGELGSRALFIGGKSMGGRMATHLAAERYRDLKGVVVLGYPLHPPGKPEQRRTAHLPTIAVPVLIVQGERDAFGTPAELRPVTETMPARVTLHVVAGGDHSLSVRGRPRGEVYAPVVKAIS